MSHTDHRDWKEFKGVGLTKISQIKAALEIARRVNEEKIPEGRPQITSSQDIADILMPRLRDLKVEIFKVVFLNAQNRIIEISDIAQGSVNHVNPVIREIFQKALQVFAVSFICAHNHPSGEVSPSLEDKIFTQKLFEAGKVLQIEVLDHIIVGNNAYYSFADQGGMK